MSALFRVARTVDFDGLYRRHAATVYRYAFAVLGNHADAEDVTQQTFLNAYRAIEQGTKPRKEQNWLLRITHNEVRRHFRRTRGKPMEVELDERVSQNGHEEERSEPTLADVLRALQYLPPLQRSALVMREFEGRPYAEIAELLNVTPSALEGQLFRARRALADHLEGALTCTDAEEAVLRRLDERLPRRVSRRLKAHLQECHSCVRFANAQKRQRALLKGLSVMPVPASLYLFRPEHAAAAGLGTTAAAAGGSAAAGGAAGAGATGLAGGLFAKAAAVTASAAVAGGVGYTVATKPPPVSDTDPKAAKAAVVRKAPRAVTPMRIAATNQGVAGSRPARPRAAHPAAPRPKKTKRRAAAHGTPPVTSAPADESQRSRGKKAPHVFEPRPTKPAPSRSTEPNPRKRARPTPGKKNEHVERPKPARDPRPHPERPLEKAKGPPPPPSLPEPPLPPPDPPRGPRK